MTFFPPLSLIEDKLFGALENEQPLGQDGAELVGDSVSGPRADENVEPMQAPEHLLPPGLAEMIHRDAATACLEDAPPAMCDIRLVRSVVNGAGQSIRDLVSPVAVLLDHANGDGSWRAWLVSSETSYASDHDLVIDHHDGPTDSRAGMVQLWNRINVRLEREAVLLGRMTLDRMALIRRLAAGSGDLRLAAVDIRPGKVGAVTLPDGQTMVTGGPVVSVNDERHDLRDLYRRFAVELNTHAATLANTASDLFATNDPLTRLVSLQVSLTKDVLLSDTLDLMCEVGGVILPQPFFADTLFVSVSTSGCKAAVQRLRQSPFVQAVSVAGVKREALEN